MAKKFDWDSFSDWLGQFGENIGRFAKGIFGSRNERVVRKLEPLVAQIKALEPWAKGLSALTSISTGFSFIWRASEVQTVCPNSKVLGNSGLFRAGLWQAGDHDSRPKREAPPVE